jgi:serine phosphatase RsbU (regulator of sigma subunit)
MAPFKHSAVSFGVSETPPLDDRKSTGPISLHNAIGPGEGVLFYTDGLVEAHNPQGEMFGTPRLRDLLSEHPIDGADSCAALMEELRRFTGEGWEQEDDITLLTLERSPSRS